MTRKPNALAKVVPLLALVALPVHALQIRAYNPAVHDRFTGTVVAPVKNPGQLYAGLDLSGIGWFAASSDIQFALVGRQHVVFATHFSPALADWLIANSSQNCSVALP